jgi:hypothetical protein
VSITIAESAARRAVEYIGGRRLADAKRAPNMTAISGYRSADSAHSARDGNVPIRDGGPQPSSSCDFGRFKIMPFPVAALRKVNWHPSQGEIIRSATLCC